MQIVNFVALPNKKPADYILSLTEIYRFIRDHQPSYAEFRKFLMERDLLDKDTFEGLLEFLGVNAGKGKPTTCNQFLPKLFDADTPTERNKILFNHLARKNEILVKYVMDGLQERLYSLNELYRFVTSYVYPGAYITLVHFRAWMSWLEASQHIKMVGIRWGLSELGDDAMNYIKTIDIDMVLDGEGDEDEDAEDDEDADSDAPAPVPTRAAAPSPAPAPAPARGTAPAPAPAVSERMAYDDGPDAASAPAARPAPAGAPQAAAAPVATAAPTASAGAASQVVFASVGAPQVVIPAGVETVRVMVQPVEPQVGGEPLKLVAEAFEAADEESLDEEGEETTDAQQLVERVRVSPALAARNLEALKASWRRYPTGRVLRATDYGFDAEQFKAQPALTLFRLSSLAVSLFRHQGQVQVGKGGEAFATLDQMGLFENLYRSAQPVDEILEGLFAGGLSHRPEVFCNLHYFLLLARAVKAMGDDGVRALAEQEEAAGLVGILWQKLAHFSLHYEVLWVARELHLLGAWQVEGLAELSVLPLPKAREVAFRLGLLETPYAADFPSLVGVSRRLSRLLSVADGLEAPLIYFQPRQHISAYDSASPSLFLRERLNLVDGE
jgi:hypothetical protein